MSGTDPQARTAKVGVSIPGEITGSGGGPKRTMKGHIPGLRSGEMTQASRRMD
jgi:hypothetical protein